MGINRPDSFYEPPQEGRQLNGEWHPAMSPLRPPPIPVTPAMIKAGEFAFRQQRRNLSDLYCHFDSDRVAFLKAIFRAMTKAAPSNG